MFKHIEKLTIFYFIWDLIPDIWSQIWYAIYTIIGQFLLVETSVHALRRLYVVSFKFIKSDIKGDDKLFRALYTYLKLVGFYGEY